MMYIKFNLYLQLSVSHASYFFIILFWTPCTIQLMTVKHFIIFFLALNNYNYKQTNTFRQPFTDIYKRRSFRYVNEHYLFKYLDRANFAQPVLHYRLWGYCIQLNFFALLIPNIMFKLLTPNNILVSV